MGEVERHPGVGDLVYEDVVGPPDLVQAQGHCDPQDADRPQQPGRQYGAAAQARARSVRLALLGSDNLRRRLALGGQQGHQRLTSGTVRLTAASTGTSSET